MATLRRNIVVTVLFTVFGGPAIGLVYLPYWITRFRIPAGEPLWQMLLGSALIFAGLAPGFESVRRFIYVGRGTLLPTEPTERLVVSGFYRYLRNPMYVGVLVAQTGEAVLFRSRDMAICMAIFALGFYIFVLFYEEPMLMRRHPVEYPRYKSHVPRWWPRLTPWQDGGN
jgi:protein-S-isoprenylcysteine O-methyltransferase Ste14